MTPELDDGALIGHLRDLESDFIERKAALSDAEEIRKAICAFANDLPGHERPGVLIIGAKDDGTPAGLAITDELLLRLAAMRSDGNITPFPTMSVQKRTVEGVDYAVVMVEPCDAPPVRLHGRTWVRVGPRKSVATREEERRLSEKRRHKDLPFDLHPLQSATIGDLDVDLFLRTYLPAALAPEILEQNNRTVEAQLAALRMTTPDGTPTVAGVLALASDPTAFLPGAYVQFVRFNGTDMAAPIVDQRTLSGPLVDVLKQWDELLAINIATKLDVTAEATETGDPDYPIVALRQISRNAVLHRSYEATNAPARIYWFADRVEISSPGGPFGQVTKRNFGKPGITDYRNPHLAEVMANLGYAQKFGMGIELARAHMARNGNPEPRFDVEDSSVLVTCLKRP